MTENIVFACVNCKEWFDQDDKLERMAAHAVPEECVEWSNHCMTEVNFRIVTAEEQLWEELRSRAWQQAIDELPNADYEELQTRQSAIFHKLLEEATPQHTHDCDNCKFLGRYGRFDLYICIWPDSATSAVARRSSDGPDYYSISDLGDSWDTIKPISPAYDALGVAIHKSREYLANNPA